MALKVGDRIKDNDPRVFNRVLTITDAVLVDGKILAEDRGRRVFKILAKRIHTDGKPRKSGFSLVTT